MVWPCFLSTHPLLLSQCSPYSCWMSRTHETHSHLRGFAGTLSTTRNVLPPDISKAHSLTSFRSQIWRTTLSPRPSQASRFKNCSCPTPLITSSFLNLFFFLTRGSRTISKYFIHLFIFLKSPISLNWGQGFLFCSLLYLQCFIQHLAQSRCSINVCWMNEWVNKKTVFKNSSFF